MKLHNALAAVAASLAGGAAMAGDIAITPSNDGGGEGLILLLAIGALLVINGVRNSGHSKTGPSQGSQDANDDDIIMKF